MGKVKRSKSKKHYSSSKVSSLPSTHLQCGTSDIQLVSKQMEGSRSSNLFRNVPIDVSKLTPLTQRGSDTMSISSKTSSLTTFIKKDERRKLRHNTFLEKLQVSRVQEQETKRREAKQKKEGNFYLQTLDDALPTLEALMKDTKSKKDTRKISQKPRLCQSYKSQRAASLKDIESMQTFLKSQNFQEHPPRAILDTLEARLQEGL